MPESSPPPRIVGILGGMGPAATVDFYAKLVAATPASQDQEHLRVVIWADPTVPSRQDALLGDGDVPTPWLEAGVEQLLRCGADVLVTPCNAVHAFMPSVLEGKDVRFISIIDATVAEVQRTVATGPVGLLATDGALAAGLYQEALQSVGREMIVPSGSSQAAVMEIVHAVKAGAAGPQESQRLSDLMSELEARGAHAVIAGCTEISALLASSVVSIPVVDSAQALAVHTVASALRVL